MAEDLPAHGLRRSVRGHGVVGRGVPGHRAAAEGGGAIAGRDAWGAKRFVARFEGRPLQAQRMLPRRKNIKKKIEIAPPSLEIHHASRSTFRKRPIWLRNRAWHGPLQDCLVFVSSTNPGMFSFVSSELCRPQRGLCLPPRQVMSNSLGPLRSAAWHFQSWRAITDQVRGGVSTARLVAAESGDDPRARRVKWRSSRGTLGWGRSGG